MGCGCCKRICTTTVRQHLAAGGVGHGALGMGIMLGWSIIAIPKIVESNDLGELTQSDKTWIANLTLVGAIVSTVLTGYLADKIGRRLTFLINCGPLLIGAVLMGVAPSVWLLCLGRFLAGYSGGAFSILIPLYITELAEDRIRGQIGYSFSQQFLAGAIVVIMLGRMVSWSIFALKCIPIVVFCFVAAYFLPESPRYLFLKGENVKAIEALTWFRVTTEKEQLDTEAKSIQARVEKLNAEQFSTLKPWLFLPVMKPIGICAGLMLLQQLSGGANFILGTIPLFPVVAGPAGDPGSLFLATAITAMITLGIASKFVDRIGRRVMLISSCLLMMLCAGALGFCHFVQAGEPAELAEKLTWFRMIFYATYIFAYSFGLGPISWLLMGELLPDRLRGPGASIVVFFNWLPAFLLVQYYSNLLQAFTIFGYFWCLAAICSLAAAYSYFVVPETNRKSLVEIQQNFEKY